MGLLADVPAQHGQRGSPRCYLPFQATRNQYPSHPKKGIAMAKHRQEPPHYDPPRIHDTAPKHRGEEAVDHGKK